MNDPYNPMKKPSGCWKWSGCMLTIVSTLLIAFFVWMIIYSEQEIDKSRQEFGASQKEYEEALEAYEADSVHLMAEYQRIQAEIEAAEKRHEPSEKIEAGAAIFVLFILIALIPLGIGLLMLLYYWLKYRKWRKNELIPK